MSSLQLDDVNPTHPNLQNRFENPTQIIFCAKIQMNGNCKYFFAKTLDKPKDMKSIIFGTKIQIKRN